MDDDNDVSTVSVVLCTYSSDLYEHFVEAAESVLGQTYDPVELVVVVDGDAGLYERVVGTYGDRDDVVVHLNDENVGLSASRNRGVELASGDVVAFIDDDAVADERWVEELVAAYRERDAPAVGGRMAPLWVAGKPEFLPEEFYWLVGVTHRGFPEEAGEVRNTFGSNISYRRDVLEALGGFDAGFGRRGGRQLQGEEAELSARLRAQFGEGVWYTPDAVVSHKVFGYRTRPRWLVSRAFWQGYSKRAMASLSSSDSAAEGAFLRRLLLEFVPDRIGAALRRRTGGEVEQLVWLAALTGAVGLGYAGASVTAAGGKVARLAPGG